MITTSIGGNSLEKNDSHLTSQFIIAKKKKKKLNNVKCKECKCTNYTRKIFFATFKKDCNPSNMPQNGLTHCLY